MPIVPSNSSPTSSEIDNPHAEPRSLPPARHRARPAAAPQPVADESPKQGSDYEVGYGRPPAHTRFKAGKSGNPKGRPKGARGLNTLARELLTARVPVRTASGEKRMHRIEAVLHAEPAPESVTFDTLVDRMTEEVVVRPGNVV